MATHLKRTFRLLRAVADTCPTDSDDARRGLEMWLEQPVPVRRRNNLSRRSRSMDTLPPHPMSVPVFYKPVRGGCPSGKIDFPPVCGLFPTPPTAFPRGETHFPSRDMHFPKVQSHFPGGDAHFPTGEIRFPLWGSPHPQGSKSIPHWGSPLPQRGWPLFHAYRQCRHASGALPLRKLRPPPAFPSSSSNKRRSVSVAFHPAAAAPRTSHPHRGCNNLFQSIADWQFRQAVDAAHILASDIMHPPWATAFNWQSLADQARYLESTHRTLARESIPVAAPSRSVGVSPNPVSSRISNRR